jgi:hypothetical protein
MLAQEDRCDIIAYRPWLLLLYDPSQTVMARATVPVRDITMAKLERLRDDLAPVFGKEWME